MCNMPDWEALPKWLKEEMNSIVSTIKDELDAIQCLGVAHPQSESRMNTIKRYAEHFLTITHRIEGANNADRYGYQHRKEQE